MSAQLEAPVLVAARCQRNGCSAKVLVGRTRAGTAIVLDARSDRRGVVHRVVLRDLSGEISGTAMRVVFEDTYQPHRYSCGSREPEPEDGGSA